MTNVPGKITASLVNAGAVPSEDKALYEYGIRQGLVLVINIVTLVMVGLLMGMVWQSIVFLLTYNPIRSYAGGYHAGTQLTCYLLSIPVMLAALFGIKLIPWSMSVVFIALIFTGITVLLLAPVEDLNKPLDKLEKAVYGKRARIALLLLSGAAIALWFAGMKQTSLSIVMALGVASVMLILGAIKNHILIEKKA
jgi:Membrane protein putatively involved in post-translational modification of the autoinducing quorum-sensing peptide